MDYRSRKELLIGAIFRPLVVPSVDICPVYLIPSWSQLSPLNTCMKHKQDVVEYLVEWQLWLRAFLWSTQVWLDVFIEVFPGHLLGDFIIAKFFAVRFTIGFTIEFCFNIMCYPSGYVVVNKNIYILDYSTFSLFSHYQFNNFIQIGLKTSNLPLTKVRMEIEYEEYYFGDFSFVHYIRPDH